MSRFIPFEAFSQRKFFGSLDGLRTISIIGVIFFHTVPLPKTWGLLAAGWAGVDLFFAISGFLITTLLLRENQRNGRISLKGFYWRRTLRIMPLYFATLLLYVAAVTVIEKDEAARHHFYGNLKFFLTYTANWFVDPAGGRVHFGFGWSLATEEQFYLFWPGLLVLARQRAVWILAGLMGLVLLGKHGAFDFLPWLPLKILTSVSPAICLGVIWAWLLNKEEWFERIYKVFGQKFSAPLVFVFTMLVLHFDLPMFVKELAFSFCVVSCVVREDHGMAWFTTWKPVAFLGTISYGIYLLHMLCANVAAKLLPFGGEDPIVRGLWKFAGTLPLVVLAATLSFKTFEAFFLKFKDRVK